MASTFDLPASSWSEHSGTPLKTTIQTKVANTNPTVVCPEHPEVMVIVPTYNEAENLPRLAAALFGLGIENLELLVIDDNSPDGTGELAERLAIQYEGRVKVIHREGKLGLGTAYVTGFKEAIACQADYIVEMDADFSHDPRTLIRFMEEIKDADVVVGSRYVSGGEIDQHWSFLRRFLSLGGSVYARFILGLTVQDTTAGFKCFRRTSLEQIELEKLRSNGFSFQVEMAYICQRKGLKVKEIPISFNDRQLGKSKMSFDITREALWRVWQIKWRH